MFCDRHRLAAQRRPADIGASAGAVEELERIVAQRRARWPDGRSVLCGDSSFARKSRLVGMIAEPLAQAAADTQQTGQPARRFAASAAATRDSGSREGRVIAKAEQTGDKSNPRFVVTTLPGDARQLGEVVYCARGDLENRIKACQLDLFADRTSAAAVRANQLRLWFAAMAYGLVDSLRRIGLAKTDLARATCGTIGLRWPEIGASGARALRNQTAQAQIPPDNAASARLPEGLTTSMPKAAHQASQPTMTGTRRPDARSARHAGSA